MWADFGTYAHDWDEITNTRDRERRVEIRTKVMIEDFSCRIISARYGKKKGRIPG